MFVYTFENIGNIKNLKHSDKIKPKHRRKMERIKEGLFANFDYLAGLFANFYYYVSVKC